MPVQVITSIEEMRSVCQQWRDAQQRIGFVPTMGNLHDGHLQLVKAARENTDRVVVSIFVNPLQFGAGEDFEKYPRSRDADLEKLSAMRVDAVFTPDEKQFYRRDRSRTTYVEVPVLSDILCGETRPRHFRGVTTVVNKLFNIVQPELAVFGTKDYQQFSIIQQMVLDLAMPIRLLGVDTVREADGLAMSSRNAYLTEQQRALAPELYKKLQHLYQQIKKGERDFPALEQAAVQELNEKGFKVDYLGIRDAANLMPPGSESDKLVILVAAWLGGTRLIDNICVIPAS